MTNTAQFIALPLTERSVIREQTIGIRQGDSKTQFKTQTRIGRWSHTFNEDCRDKATTTAKAVADVHSNTILPV